MRRIVSIGVVIATLMIATLAVIYGNSFAQKRVQGVNANVQTAEEPSRDEANLRNVRKGKMLVKRLPDKLEGVELKEGVLKLKDGYKFDKKDDGTVTIARMGGGGLGETGGTWQCDCGAEGGGTCKASVVLGTLSCAAGTCKDCFLSVTVGKLTTNIMRY